MAVNTRHARHRTCPVSWFLGGIPCPGVPLTPRRASVRRNLSSRKVARPSRADTPTQGGLTSCPAARPGHRLDRPSKIDHRRIVVRTCRIVSCPALVTCQPASDAVRPACRPTGRWVARRSKGRRLLGPGMHLWRWTRRASNWTAEKNASFSQDRPYTQYHQDLSDWTVTLTLTDTSNEHNEFQFDVLLVWVFEHLFRVNIIPPPIHRERGIVFDRFLYLYLCFFVSKITRKQLDRFAWNFPGRCGVTTGRPDYIFGQFRETARCDAQHEDGVCCALAPQLVSFDDHRAVECWSKL